MNAAPSIAPLSGSEALIQLALAGVNILLWSALLGRHASMTHAQRRRDPVPFWMYVVVIAVAVGSFASAWGAAQRSEDIVLPIIVEPHWLVFVTSMARGALAMSGLILLFIGPRSIRRRRHRRQP